MNRCKFNIWFLFIYFNIFRPWHIRNMVLDYNIEEPSDMIADIIKWEVSPIRQYIISVIGRDIYRCDILMSMVIISYFYPGEQAIEEFLKTRPFDIGHHSYIARPVVGFKGKYTKRSLLLWICMISHTQDPKSDYLKWGKRSGGEAPLINYYFLLIFILYYLFTITIN
jgi:hypothetical protein